MGMRELLRVAMNERQVREACEDWARSRARTDDTAAMVTLAVNGAYATQPVSAEVIFTKKRERKPKAQA
jgi:hypothetical protein